MSADEVWALESMEASSCNEDGFFPLELNVTSLATGAHKKLILAMSVKFLEEFLTDLTDIQLAQLEYVNKLQADKEE